MNIILYIVIFIIGSICGGFCVSTVHRIMQNQKIFELKSYCPKCGEKLKFLEMVPILNYIFLRGRCKHCRKKIDITYIIFEILTGIIFVAFCYCLNINVNTIGLTKIISLIFVLLYVIYIMLVCCMSIKNNFVSQHIITYGIALSLLYIIFKCVIDVNNIFMQIIYLVFIIIVLLIDTMKTKKYAESSNIINILTILLIMIIFTGEIVCILTVMGTLMTTAFFIIIKKLQKLKLRNKKASSNFHSELKFGFIMGILNILILLTVLNGI